MVGVGSALQQDLSYAPLVEALRPLVRQAAGPGRPALVEGLLDLGRLFGDLSLPVGPALGDPGLERTRLFESVCRLLERASARQPLALLLEDVQWADRGSLALLHYLIRGLTNRPLLVLLTHREDELNPALGELLAGLRRGGSLTELELAGLTDQAVGLLAQNLLGGQAPAGLLDVLAARSGGVPLFVGALVRSFTDSGALYRYDGRWAMAPQRPEAVPVVVSALLQSHVERLPDEARQALDLLAVCGAQADHALLERLMPGDRLLRGIADLWAAGHVVVRPGGVLLIEDADHFPVPAAESRLHTEVFEAAFDSAVRAGMAKDWTRRLPTELRRRGLRDVWADCEVPLFEGGSVHSQFWRLSAAQARDLVIAEGVSPQRFDEWDRQLGESGRWFPSMAMVAACGRRDDWRPDSAHPRNSCVFAVSR